MRHRTLTDLEPHLDHLASSPKDVGVLELVVCRPAKGGRRILDGGVLDLDVGLVGDSWSTRTHKPPHPEKQVTLMSSRMVSLLSSDPAEQALAGDQLYVDLDLSVGNLPVGTRLEIGSATVEITAPPHAGCAIFVRHFGEEAMRFVNSRTGRAMRLRGVNARVVAPGSLRTGDKVTAVREPALW